MRTEPLSPHDSPDDGPVPDLDAAEAADRAVYLASSRFHSAAHTVGVRTSPRSPEPASGQVEMGSLRAEDAVLLADVLLEPGLDPEISGRDPAQQPDPAAAADWLRTALDTLGIPLRVRGRTHAGPTARVGLAWADLACLDALVERLQPRADALRAIAEDLKTVLHCYGLYSVRPYAELGQIDTGWMDVGEAATLRERILEPSGETGEEDGEGPAPDFDSRIVAGKVCRDLALAAGRVLREPVDTDLNGPCRCCGAALAIKLGPLPPQVARALADHLCEDSTA